eukprot:1813844-Amphidinium_carterae.1
MAVLRLFFTQICQGPHGHLGVVELLPSSCHGCRHCVKLCNCCNGPIPIHRKDRPNTDPVTAAVWHVGARRAQP